MAHRQVQHGSLHTKSIISSGGPLIIWSHRGSQPSFSAYCRNRYRRDEEIPDRNRLRHRWFRVRRMCPRQPSVSPCALQSNSTGEWQHHRSDTDDCREISGNGSSMTQISSKDADPRDIDLGKTLVLLTYTLPPDARRRGYNEWLRQVDNPFFNSIVGIEHYSNWEILESDRVSLPFSHFDLLFVDGPDSLEGVWFNQELEVFRREWMEKWDTAETKSLPPTRLHIWRPGRRRVRYLLANCAAFPPTATRSRMAGPYAISGS